MKLSTLILTGSMLLSAPAYAQPTHKYHGRQNAPVAIDANGKLIGTLFGEGLGNSTELAIRKLPDGTTVALPVSVQGFVDEATTGSIGFLTLWYPTNDCSGPGYIALGTGFDPRTGQPLNIQPLVQETTDGGALATYVFNSTLYYADPKQVGLTSFNSFAACSDPVQCPNDPQLGPCQSLLAPQVQMGGPMVSFDLGSLGFVAPFAVQQ